ncbi:ROK family transcriptional regulator [Paenibacillus beijingensis]|uniref:ROK family protein n=1 Tax=Paenibacillus beijingensis TaxID=1126833 RepID=A0A0D5NDY9_9BACL|nr:ROK family transcriptional regulator [Paenibacillus beijingensis]AJY73466.1 hypothetical protein VN24_01040 [Paenibacillus beijingensis]
MGDRLKHDQEFIKKKNQILILEIIQKNNRRISRADIAKMTKMSPASVGRIVNTLIETGLIKETDQQSSGVGRKATMLECDVQSLLAIGVEVDRNVIKAAIVDLDGRIITEAEKKADNSANCPETVASRIIDLIRQLADGQKVELNKFIGIGIGIPGIINPDTGEVIISAQLKWKNERFASLIEDKLPLPVVLDNDLKVKALGESSYWPKSDETKTVLVSVGSGVGSALVDEGEIYRGANNIAGEIGHSTVNPDGMLCECGKRGCLQTYITDLSLLQEANQVRPVHHVEDIFEAMRNGETWAYNIIERACTYIAVTINNVVCTYNPDRIILTGNFIEHHSDTFEMVRAKMKDFIWEPFSGTFDLSRSKLGENSVRIGAAKLVLQQRLKQGLPLD